MTRVVFPILILGALFAVVPFMTRTLGSGPDGPRHELTDPDRTIDVDALRKVTENRTLRVAGETDLALLRSNASVGQLVQLLHSPSERERRLAAAALGASGVEDGVGPLIRAFERETSPRALASLAVALAESRDPEAIRALIEAIRTGKPLPVYEAYRALKNAYGLNLAPNADAWDRWFNATLATRD